MNGPDGQKIGGEIAAGDEQQDVGLGTLQPSDFQSQEWMRANDEHIGLPGQDLGESLAQQLIVRSKRESNFRGRWLGSG